MNNIATLSTQKNPAPLCDIMMRNQQIIIHPYHLGLRKNKVIEKIADAGIHITALDNTTAKAINKNWPFFPARGKLLKIALLPQILDQTYDKWREEMIRVNCDHLAGIMAAHILAKETKNIYLCGTKAQEVKEMIFYSYGLIPITAPPTIDLAKLALPNQVISPQCILPIELAEALLLAVSQIKPTLSPEYLFALNRRAAYYDFSSFP